MEWMRTIIYRNWWCLIGILLASLHEINVSVNMFSCGSRGQLTIGFQFFFLTLATQQKICMQNYSSIWQMNECTNEQRKNHTHNNGITMRETLIAFAFGMWYFRLSIVIIRLEIEVSYCTVNNAYKDFNNIKYYFIFINRNFIYGKRRWPNKR